MNPPCNPEGCEYKEDEPCFFKFVVTGECGHAVRVMTLKLTGGADE